MVVYPEQGKAKQGSAQAEAPKSAARERDEQREVRKMFKMLREV